MPSVRSSSCVAALFVVILIGPEGSSADHARRIDGFAQDTADAKRAAPLPAPIPGFPIGWCVRARAEVFADAKAAGFEYVELALQDVLDLSEEDFVKLAGELKRLDLGALSGYNPIPADLKLVGPDVDQARLDRHLAHLVRRAAALRLTYLIFNSGASWRVPDGFPQEQALGQLASVGRRFANAAAARGITVLVSSLRSTDSNLLTTLADTLTLVKTVDHPNFAMMVDYSFLRIQKDDPKVLLSAGTHLRHVHVANPTVPRVYPMSEGESDYKSFFDVLAQIGYRGGLSVHAGTSNFAAEAPRALAFLRARARELAAPPGRR